MSNWSLLSWARAYAKIDKLGGVNVWLSEKQIKSIRSENPPPKGVVVNQHFPEAQIVASIGKRIYDVIDHPIVREHFGPEDTVKEAFLTDGAGFTLTDLSVFEVRRKRKPRAVTATADAKELKG
ncbi:hypothetical protein AAG612_09895 [Citromicrobium bathyomarinum]|uniref:hypothetical protein n=1 Tax=Citromicrobium bathyomarinum TaxID=72174 RepID=UPI00315AC70B